jgi:Endoplasmic Reticulum Oxidoreductin 1 (ERO1)
MSLEMSSPFMLGFIKNCLRFGPNEIMSLFTDILAKFFSWHKSLHGSFLTLFFQKLHPLLQNLLEKSYFRYFQYNPNRKCPFWDMSKEVCHSGACGVKPCPKDKIPEAVLTSTGKQACIECIE